MSSAAFRRQREIEAEPFREALAGFWRETFEMIVHENPDAANVAQMPLDTQRPAFERSLAFPEQFAVAMKMSAVTIVFRGVIAKQAQIDEIGCARQKFERREVAFIQRTRVGPHPADAMFFQKPNDLRPMPAGMAEFDRETKIPRQLFEEFAQRRFTFLRCEGRRQLDQEHVQLRRERLPGRAGRNAVHSRNHAIAEHV